MVKFVIRNTLLRLPEWACGLGKQQLDLGSGFVGEQDALCSRLGTSTPGRGRG